MLERQTVPRPAARPDDAPIFVVGTGRSGTTLLRQMLNAHPAIHLAHEASVYFYAALAPRGAPVRAWLERYFDTFSFAWLRLAPRAVRAALPPPGAPARDVDAVRAVLRTKAAQYGKARYGEKNPLDTASLARIFRDFPDPRVIAVVRDPRATVASLARMPWGSSSAALGALFCRWQHARLAPFRSRVLEVRLEDLVAAPRATMRSVLTFVGEPFCEAVLDPARHATGDDVAPFPWFADATRAPVGRGGRGDAAWEAALAPAAVRLIEHTNHAAMTRYGYPAASLAREPGVVEMARLVAGELGDVAALAHRARRYHRRLVAHMRGGARFDPAVALAASLQFNPAAWRHYPGFVMPPLPAREAG